MDKAGLSGLAAYVAQSFLSMVHLQEELAGEAARWEEAFGTDAMPRVRETLKSAIAREFATGSLSAAASAR